jgi:predicted transcriptional regulator
MARPATKELTDRELEVMHIFWEHGEQTAQEARDRLESQGVERAYVTIANLVRILVEKGYLQPVNKERPFRYLPTRSFSDVSTNLVGDLVRRVFHGSREQMLVHLLQAKKLTKKEKATLRSLLEDE